jgi:hypothetical protein
MTILLIALAINLVISMIITNAAKTREISSTKVFLVSFLLTPILGMFIVLLSKEKKESDLLEVSDIDLLKSKANEGARTIMAVLIVMITVVGLLVHV